MVFLTFRKRSSLKFMSDFGGKQKRGMLKILEFLNQICHSTFYGNYLMSLLGFDQTKDLSK